MASSVRTSVGQSVRDDLVSELTTARDDLPAAVRWQRPLQAHIIEHACAPLTLYVASNCLV